MKCLSFCSMVLFPILFIILSTTPAYTQPLQCELSIAKGKSFNLAFDKPLLNFKLTNKSKESVYILGYETPINGIDNNFFTIGLNGKSAIYKGRMVLRMGPLTGDWIKLSPGGFISAVIDLSKYYRLDQVGKYSVFYQSLQYALKASSVKILPAVDMSKANYNTNSLFAPSQVPQMVKSNTITLAISGTKASGNLSIGFMKESRIGCNESDHTILKNDQNNGKSQANKARSRIENNKWYGTWFGSYNAANAALVKNNYTEIKNALGEYTHYDCSGSNCQPNWLAYVYPTKPYYTWICNAYWYEGSSVRASILLHEASHWNNVAQTLDYIYGYSQSQNLAKTKPYTAVTNADNYRLGGLYAE